MKKDELREALIEKGVPSMFYNLDGNGRTDERHCLEFTNQMIPCFRCTNFSKYVILISMRQKASCRNRERNEEIR